MFEVTLENELDKSVEILANNRRAKKSGPGRSWNKSSRSFCGVLDCSNCTYSCPDLWFFRLPLHSIEAKRRNVWLKQIGRTEILPFHRLLVCEKHFNPEDIAGNIYKARRLLKPHAIPTLLLPSRKPRPPIIRAKPKRVYQRINNSETKTYNKKDVTCIEEPSTTGHQMSMLNEHTQNDCNDNTNDSNAEVELSDITSRCNTLDSKTLMYFIKSQKLKENTKNNSEAYSDQFKLKMFKLYNKNAQVYEVLQSTLGLPPVSILPSFIPSTPAGITEIYIDNIKDQIGHNSLVQKCCTLCLSLTRVKPCVSYDYNLDIVSGLCGRSKLVPVQYAVIAMVRGIIFNWHFVVSITLLASLDMFTEYNTWLDNLIMSMMEIGINIKTVVTTTDNFFINAFALRDVNVTKPYFIINKRRIYHLFDPLHLMLLLYDELKNNAFVFTEQWQGKKKFANWEHISQFYKHDSARPFRLANNLSVIDPNDSQKNKLKSAAQILSMSTATGLSIFIDLQILDREAIDTLDFIVKINKILVALYPDANQPEYKHNMVNQEFKFWQENIQFFEGIKFNQAKHGDEEKLKKCFIRSMRSVVSMQEEYYFKEHVPIVTQYLNQDPLVEFIHKMNLNDFKHTYPDLNEFLKILKSDIIQNNIQNKKSEVNDSHIENFIKNANIIIEQKLCEDVEKTTAKRSLEDNEADYTQIEDCDANSLLYVATYLLDKMYQKYKNSVSSRMKLMNSCVYYENRKEKLRGALIVPDDDFLQCVFNMDAVFINYCKKAIATGSLNEELMKQMNKFISPGPIEVASLNYVLGLFVDLRIYHTMKYNNHIYEIDAKDDHQFVLRRLNSQGLNLAHTKKSIQF